MDSLSLLSAAPNGPTLARGRFRDEIHKSVAFSLSLSSFSLSSKEINNFHAKTVSDCFFSSVSVSGGKWCMCESLSRTPIFLSSPNNRWSNETFHFSLFLLWLCYGRHLKLLTARLSCKQISRWSQRRLRCCHFPLSFWVIIKWSGRTESWAQRRGGFNKKTHSIREISMRRVLINVAGSERGNHKG